MRTRIRRVSIEAEGLPERPYRLLRQRTRAWPIGERLTRSSSTPASRKPSSGECPQGVTHSGPLGPRLLLSIPQICNESELIQSMSAKGLQSWRCGMRGLLREGQERVLPPLGLVKGRHRGVHVAAGYVPGVLLREMHQGIPGLDGLKRVRKGSGIPCRQLRKTSASSFIQKTTKSLKR